MLPTRLLLAASLLVTAPARAGADEMRPLTINGYQLIDAQYLGFAADMPFHYPEDVLWGFNVSGTTDAARACALTAFRQLESFFAADCGPLHQVVALGGTPRFYLWLNDYTAASPTRQRRLPRLWHWNDGAGPRDYASGAWEWEATVVQDGSCLLPSADQVALALSSALSVLTH